VSSQNNPAVLVPPQYEDVDIGDAEPVRCLKTGLWFLEESGIRYVVLLAPAERYGQTTGVQFQIGVPNSVEGTGIAQLHGVAPARTSCRRRANCGIPARELFQHLQC